MCDDQNGLHAIKSGLANLSEDVFTLRLLAERTLMASAHAPRVIFVFAWYMGDGDVLVVSATSLSMARAIGRAKIRAIYIEAMWERKYQILNGRCMKMEPGSAIFVGHEDLTWAEDDEYHADKKNREGDA